MIQETAIINEYFVPVTPRREDEMKSFISFTPIGDDFNQYKYYCPICMNHYKDILKSSCCNNYICYPCTEGFLSSKRIEVDSINDIIRASISNLGISCPHCSTVGFNPRIVHEQEQIRDYSTKDHQPKPSTFRSPLRVGDSFEDLKRKMIMFKDIKEAVNVTDDVIEEFVREDDSETLSRSSSFDSLMLVAKGSEINEDPVDLESSVVSVLSTNMINAIIESSVQRHSMFTTQFPAGRGIKVDT